MKVIRLSNKIITIENFLSPVECQEYIALSEEIGYEAAKLDNKKAVNEVRNNQSASNKSQDKVL